VFGIGDTRETIALIEQTRQRFGVAKSRDMGA
jgi:hypothetical protein